MMMIKKMRTIMVMIRKMRKIMMMIRKMRMSMFIVLKNVLPQQRRGFTIIIMLKRLKQVGQNLLG